MPCRQGKAAFQLAPAFSASLEQERGTKHAFPQTFLTVMLGWLSKKEEIPDTRIFYLSYLAKTAFMKL